MKIRKGSELEDMSAMTDERLRFWYHGTKIGLANTPNGQFIHQRCKQEINRRCKDAAHYEIS